MKENGEDKEFLGEVFELGQTLGRGVQLQYKVLLPLSAYFKDGRYSDQAPYLKDGILGWLDTLLSEMEQLSLVDTNGFRQINDMKDRIKAENATKEELLKFDEELLSWYRDFNSSLSGQSSDEGPVWFKMGFFSQYMMAKMRLHEEISQYNRTSEFDLGSYRKELVDAMEKEVFVTGWLDQDWVRKLNKMRIPYDSRVLKEFISDSREILGLKEKEGTDLKLRLRGLLKQIPFIGPRL